MIQNIGVSVCLFFIGVCSAETISADIVKGYSWEYNDIYYAGNVGQRDSGIVKISIDSVWGDLSDTLYFRVSRYDSVYFKANDSIYKISIQGDAKKINGTVSCDIGLISTMFRNYEYRQYDSSNAYFSNQASIGTVPYNNDTLNTFQHSSRGSMPPHAFTYLNITDRIGMTIIASGNSSSGSSSSETLTLQEYCGKDFISTAGIKNTFSKPIKTNQLSPLQYHKTLCRSNINKGYSLLGKAVSGRSGSLGILIQRETNPRLITK